MKDAIFWDVMPRGSCKNWHFGETYCLDHQDDKKRQFLQKENGITSQETTFFIVTDMKTSNHTQFEFGFPRKMGHKTFHNF
jgi:hypothetical protein